ncbi:MAG: hypothetical protein DCC65_06960 [Planctomycetota bacterium]|nr:MAG: hypothetical protein DCC65_06960 [Planctomycetota bacterium]
MPGDGVDYTLSPEIVEISRLGEGAPRPHVLGKAHSTFKGAKKGDPRGEKLSVDRRRVFAYTSGG